MNWLLVICFVPVLVSLARRLRGDNWARLRQGGWRTFALVVAWVASCVPIVGSLHSTELQLLGIVVMTVGAWWMQDRLERRTRLN